MFIQVTYKDTPELSNFLQRSSEPDLSIEKILLVNPKCHVRVLLEYLRKKCRLATSTVFDLCDESGVVKGLFSLPTYAYPTELFEHKKIYYLVVIRQENDKRISVLPQLNRNNLTYMELKGKVTRYMLTGETSPQGTGSSGKATPPSQTKGTGKKK